MLTPQETIAREIWDLFTEPTPPQRAAFLHKLEHGDIPASENKFAVFSPFKKEHSKRAWEITEHFRTTLKAAATEEQGLKDVITSFRNFQSTQNPDLLYYSLESFLTRHRGNVQVVIPSILVREPELAAPFYPKKKGINLKIALGSPEETRMDWFREDPLLNEHHHHWHIVYDRNAPKDRQGEMFLYMHQQMLARYDAERLSLDLPLVQPFHDMENQRIEVGYTAGPDGRLAGVFRNDRPPRVYADQDGAAEQISLRNEVSGRIDSGEYDPADPFDKVAETQAVDRFGSVIESNNRVPDNEQNNYHGMGHGIIGDLNQGVMLYPMTAIRDVIFWQWHKHVDNLYGQLQDRFEPYSFSTDAPTVSFRKGVDDEGRPFSADLILCLMKDIPGYGQENFNGSILGNSAFGGDSWNKEFASGTHSFTDAAGNNIEITITNTLETSMQTGQIQYRNPANPALIRTVEYNYLHHAPFAYFIRLRNDSQEIKQVTVRLFIVPADQANDRRRWLEMDKFLYELQPESNTVIFRADTEASIIRKPAVTDPATANTQFNPVGIPNQNSECTCGWPYHLLLPRGRAEGEGMEFILMAMVTDGEQDLAGQLPDCGSLSFCGARDDAYPDSRPLGYPFNRRFEGNGQAILNTIRTQPNMACRTIFIKHTGQQE